MTYFPSKVHNSVVDGVDQQNMTVWCLSGIDLFVDLRIDSPEPPQAAPLSSRFSSEAPGPRRDEFQAFVAPPVGPCDVEESTHPAQTLRSHEKERYEVSQEESRRSSEPHGESSRESENEFQNPVPVYIEELQQVNGTSWPRGDGVDMQETPSIRCDSSARKSEEHLTFIPGELQLREPLLHNKDGDDPRIEDLKDKKKSQLERVEKSDKCSENRSWSPEIEDYSWAPERENMDTCSGSDRHVDEVIMTQTRKALCTNDFKFQDNCEQECANLRLSSHSSSDNSNEGLVVELKHDMSPKFSISPSQSRFSGIDSFNLAEVSAACQLLKLSCWDRREEFSEQELAALQEFGVHNLGIRNVSSLEGLSRMVQKIHSAVPGPDVDSPEAAHAMQPRKIRESWWSGDESYNPRLLSAKKARENDRRKRIKLHNRPSLRDSETDQESDWEVFRKPRKRQYKSIHELALA